MVADVPLGGFISGGVDSSMVVALMQEQRTSPVRTFSIGFQEASYDESPFAAAVARHLGTEHTSLTLSPAESRAVIPRLADMYDEPFADTTQIPTYLVSALARSDVTVALSGDGGDELFAGYARYQRTRTIWHVLSRIPIRVRRVAARTIRASAPTLAPRLLDRLLERPGTQGRLEKLAEIAEAVVPDDVYRCLVSAVREPSELMLLSGDLREHTPRSLARGRIGELVEQLMLADMTVYLPDDLLAKLDRASMAVSLESRVPLLDHRLVEFAWSLPLRLKVSRGRTKLLLKQVLADYVPREMFDRPKMGFEVPISQWLRGPLADWASALLAPSQINDGHVLNSDAVQRLWAEHRSGRRDAGPALWAILMFEAWRQRWQPAT